jgi:hypothetical protein
MLTFACYERDELAHAFLHAFLGLFGDFGIFWQRRFHDTGHWCEIPYVSIGQLNRRFPPGWRQIFCAGTNRHRSEERARAVIGGR